MSNSQRLIAAETRRKNWRIALGTIIAITIPFYCAGFFLWGTAPQRTPTPIPATATLNGPQVVTATSLPPTITPFGAGPASITPLGITPFFPTQDNGGFPTQVLPTLVLPTRFLSPTPQIIIPTNPPPPTNVPQPTNPPPPTQPAITNTPLPFDN